MENDIKSYSREQLADILSELGQPSFRAKQIFQWLYAHNAQSYDDMTNVPATLRATLAELHPLRVPRIVDKQVSRDGTRKYVIEYHDGARVETVAIPSSSSLENPSDTQPDEGTEQHPAGKKRLTVCFSTQAGCAMACAFCATGKEGFTRNLTPGEMIDQILIAQQDLDLRVSNLVAMGQGEPFLNYDNTIAALRIANAQDALNIGARHITVSTCGVLKGIEKFAYEPEQFTLAVSLHSAEQRIRDILMPKVANAPLPRLKRTLRAYLENTNRRVTFEYILINKVNDSPKALEALVSFCDGLLCHVNLLPMNTVEGSPYQPSSDRTTRIWYETLNRAGIETTIRNSRGSDIAGACGQLKNSLL